MKQASEELLNDFKRLAWDKNIGPDGDQVTRPKAYEMYTVLKRKYKDLTPFNYSVLYEDVYGFSGFMCETITNWINFYDKGETK